MIDFPGYGELDSVDLAAMRRRGIKVSYTTDAPAPQLQS